MAETIGSVLQLGVELKPNQIKNIVPSLKRVIEQAEKDNALQIKIDLGSLQGLNNKLKEIGKSFKQINFDDYIADNFKKIYDIDLTQQAVAVQNMVRSLSSLTRLSDFNGAMQLDTAQFEKYLDFLNLYEDKVKKIRKITDNNVSVGGFESGIDELVIGIGRAARGAEQGDINGLITYITNYHEVLRLMSEYQNEFGKSFKFDDEYLTDEFASIQEQIAKIVNSNNLTRLINDNLSGLLDNNIQFVLPIDAKPDITVEDSGDLKTEIKKAKEKIEEVAKEYGVDTTKIQETVEGKVTADVDATKKSAEKAIQDEQKAVDEVVDKAQKKAKKSKKKVKQTVDETTVDNTPKAKATVKDNAIKDYSYTAKIQPKLSDDFKEKAIALVEAQNLEAAINLRPQYTSESGDGVSTSLTEEVGKIKAAIAENDNVALTAVNNEYSQFEALERKLQDVIARLGEVNQALKVLGGFTFQDLEKSLKLPKGFKPEQYTELSTAFSNLKVAIGNFDTTTFSSLISDLNSMNLGKDQASRLTQFGEALENVKRSFDTLGEAGTEATDKFIADLKDLLSHSQELADLSNILKASGGNLQKVVTQLNAQKIQEEKDGLAAKQAAANAKVESIYQAQINDLTEIIRLKKEAAKVDPTTSQYKEYLKTIGGYQSKVNGRKSALNKALENEYANGTFASEQKKYNELLSSSAGLTTSNKLKSDSANANAKALATINALIEAYKELYRLKQELAKAAQGEDVEAIRKATDAYNDQADAIRNAEGYLEERLNAKNISKTFDKELEKLSRSRFDIIDSDQIIEDAKRVQDQTTVLTKDSLEFKSVINKLFSNASAEASEYISKLGEVEKITTHLSRNKSTGEDDISYEFKGTNGNLIMGANGDVLKYNNELISTNNAWKQITAAVKLYNAETEKSKNGTKVLSDEQNAALSEMSSIFSELKEKTGAVAKNNYKLTASDDIEEATEDFIKLGAACGEFVAEYKTLPRGLNDTSIDKSLAKVYQYMERNTKAARTFKDEFDRIIESMQQAGNTVDLNKANNKFLSLQNAISATGLGGESFFDQFAREANYNLSSMLAQYLSFQDVVRYSREAVSTINDLDYALLDLKKTTAMSNEELEEFYSNASNMAGELDVTTEEVISLASAWSRLGYSSKDAAESMAALTAEMAAISPGMTTDQAQEGMVSLMKAFNVDVDDVRREIMDNVNVLGNSFALENQDIIDGMQKSASALAVTGTSLQEAFALFTGGQEIVQDAESMGTALRTISLRIRGYSEESEDGALELDDSLKTISGDLIDLTKIAGVLPEGISIYTDDTKYLDDANKEYKSLVEYLGQIHDYWDEFSETQQNQLLQKLFGKTRAKACPYVQKCA